MLSLRQLNIIMDWIYAKYIIFKVFLSSLNVFNDIEIFVYINLLSYQYVAFILSTRQILYVSIDWTYSRYIHTISNTYVTYIYTFKIIIII